MSDRYWDKAWSLIDSCTPISEGCENCWSAALDFRFAKGNARYCNTENKTFFYKPVRIREDRLDIPKRTKKQTTFSIWNDLYHQQVDDGFRIKAYGVMERCTQHIFLILTKREKELRYYFQDRLPYRDHIWHGVTAETQQRADERIPYLLQVPGKKFLSLEPLLSEIFLRWYWMREIDLIIVGCETGNPHRPCKLSWIESIVQQCKDANVPCFVKAININSKVIRDIEKFPEHLKVRSLLWLKKEAKR